MSFTQSASGEMRFRLGSQTRTEIRENKLCSRRGKQATKSLELGGGERDTIGPSSPPLHTPIPSSLTMRNQQSRGGNLIVLKRASFSSTSLSGETHKRGTQFGTQFGGTKGDRFRLAHARSSRVCSGPLVLLLLSLERVHSAPFASKQHH